MNGKYENKIMECINAIEPSENAKERMLSNIRRKADARAKLVDFSARKFQNRKPAWVKWASAAACFAIILTAAVFIASQNTPTAPVTPVSRVIEKNTTTDFPGCAAVSELKPWDKMEASQQYPEFKYNKADYQITCPAISQDMIGEVLGTVSAVGYDDLTGEEHITNLSIHRINGISADYAVAAFLKDGSAYAYENLSYSPKTLGQLFDDLGLRSKLRFSYAHTYGDTVGRDPNRYYQFSRYDVDRFSELFYSCEDAIPVHRSRAVNGASGRLITVDIYVEGIGFNPHLIWITADGYIGTSLIAEEVEFNVGERADELFRIIADTAASVTAIEEYRAEFPDMDSKPIPEGPIASAAEQKCFAARFNSILSAKIAKPIKKCVHFLL